MPLGPRKVDYGFLPSLGKAVPITLWAAGAAGVALACDLLLPTSVAAGILYVLIVLATLGSRRARDPWIAAAVATALCVAGLFVSHTDAGFSTAITNRALSIAILWMTAGLIARTRQTAKAIAPLSVQPGTDPRIPALMNARDEAVIETDADGRIINWNSAAKRLFHCTLTEVAGKPLSILIAEPQRAEAEILFAQARAGMQVVRFDSCAVTHTGTPLPVSMSVVSIDDDQGASCGLAVAIHDLTERRLAAELLSDQAELTALTGTVGMALAGDGSLRNILQHCAEALVRHLDAAFARIWTLSDDGTTLELQASAGMYTHIDGGHARVPVGQFKIGRIAKERKPHWTNSVIGDPRVNDQAWAKREGMVSFAGHPIVLEGRLLGVVAVFARHPLSATAVVALERVAEAVALGIERKRAEDEVQRVAVALDSANQKTEAILRAAMDGIITTTEAGVITTVNPSAEQMFGYSAQEILDRNISVLLQDVTDWLQESRDPSWIGQALSSSIGSPRVFNGCAKDGSTFPVELSVGEMHIKGQRGLTCIFRDIRDRIESERQRELYTIQLEAQALEIQGRTEELEFQHRTLEAMNRALQEASNRAEAAVRSKSEFLANMSHEIRTPMTAIVGYAESLMDPELPLTDRMEAVHTIRRNADHLLNVLTDILDIARFDAGRMTVDCVPCSPIEILAEVASIAHARAESKGLTFETVYATPIPDRIATDRTRVRQILINLIGNAIKFTESGNVELKVSYTDDANDPQCTFDVTDTGIGMTDEIAASLFQAFSQADTSMSRRFGGSGLGLLISRRLARLLGGNVELIDTQAGSGAHFRAIIAAGRVEGSRSVPQPQQAMLAAEATDSVTAQPSQKALSGFRILLAEDSPDNQKLISLVLKKAGAETELAENGKIALDAALRARQERRPFDVILMDMQMPEMDGYQAASYLRAEGYDRPIIALTAHAMATDREKCLQAGCDEFATKPIDRKLLVDLIRRSASMRRGAPKSAAYATPLV